ncbi:MAG: ATP-binding cassette domain-containing protein, partial [Proteobacteria bacterium]|nr:ATP-binding cassette domain-containing protein [Pseudomonadota bacterium]
MSEVVIEACDVYRSVNTPEGILQILSGINLKVFSGQSVAILGESGSGKSTLLGLLAGLDLPQLGQIKINNQEITNMDEDERAVLRASCTGFVFQSFYLMEDLNALENVALPL